MMSQEKTKELAEVSSCSQCPMNKTCVVYINGIETLKILNQRFVEELHILDKIVWKPEDLANGCKFKPIKLDGFGI